MVLWYSDNAACASITRKGSMKEVLNPIAAKIQQVCENGNIDLQVKWIRRDKNSVADTLSRFVDLDDWGIVTQLMDRLQKDWLPCEVDCFASAKNAKLDRFDSRFTEAGAKAVNAFSQAWGGSTSWLVPPPKLIPHAIQHLVKCRVKGIMVTPY